MGSLSAGEDAGEVAGPILAGFLWSTWGVPALLGVRIALAVVTELYAVALGRSLGKPRASHQRQQEYSAMHLTPPEIQSQPLKGRGRGYDREDVDRLLEHVAASYEQVWRERDALRARITELEEKLDSFRESERLLGETLVTAQRAADQVGAEAKREAERLVRTALEDRERMKAAAEQELEDLQAGIELLRSLKRDVASNLRANLEEGLRLIEDGRPLEAAPPSETLAEVLKPEPTRLDDRHA